MVKRKTTSTNYLNQSYLENKCPLNELLFLLSKRWMTDILFCIEDGNNRFSGIKEELKYISDHILSHRLRSLETAGLIDRISYEAVPPRVEYSITEKGKELSGVLEQLCNFASELKQIPA